MTSSKTNIREKYEQIFENVYQKLNNAQREAVDITDGPVMVIAGPGTGKTQILAVRIGKILKQADVSAHNLLCLTYTDSATVAMRNRLVEIIGPEAHKVHIYTFHAFCNQVIQENPAYFGNYRQLEPITDLERIDVYMEILDSLPGDHILKRIRGDANYELRRLDNLFRMMKKENLDETSIGKKIDDFLETKEKNIEDKVFFYQRKYKEYLPGDKKPTAWEKLEYQMKELRAAVVLYEPYQVIMDRMGRYDYDDMILWVIKAFDDDDLILAKYQERYQYFLVDEYQDTNGSQNMVLEKLITFMDHRPNVFVVGDDDQAIYKFQGANLNNIKDFKAGHDPHTIVLENNYRSNQPILSASSALIDFNQGRLIKEDNLFGEKNLIASGGYATDTTIPRIRCYENIVQEQADLASSLCDAYGETEDLSNTAILYRKHAQVEKLVEVLEKKNIPLNIKRKVDILKIPLIDNVLNILYYIQAEYHKPNSEEYRLFEIMHYHFFNIDTSDIAKISLFCREGKYEDPRFFRVVMADREALNELDIKSVDEIISLNEILNKWTSDLANVTLQTLFQNVLNEGLILRYIFDRAEKTWLLQVVSTLFDSIKEESRKSPDIKLSSFLDNITKMKKAELPLQVNKIVNSKKGVHFITAHSAKGLEFQNVHIIGCDKEAWDKNSRKYNQYTYPDNINEDSAVNIEDERRLFFVAMTRAEKNLVISYSLHKENGKDLGASQFVDEIIAATNLTIENVEVPPVTINDFEYYNLLKNNKEVKLFDNDLLNKVLENYKLSVTSLNKYLKCTVSFYFESILRVPSARNIYTGFGRAVHRALQLFFEDINANKERSKETLVKHFNRGMQEVKSHFTDKEYGEYIDYGTRILNAYYDENLLNTSPAKSYEMECKLDNAEYNGVPIKGVLDMVEVYDGYINVVDYKTGKFEKSETKSKLRPPTSNKPAGGDYWRQIVFYKMLVDSDKKHNWNMTSGVIDFVEPDKKSGKFKNEKYVISDKDLEVVGQQVEETWKNINEHKFGTLCDDDKCYWCDFVRNDYMFSDEMEADMVEENQDL